MTNIRDYILDGTPEDVVTRYESLPEIAEKSDFGVLDSNVVVVDTETTGFSFTHDELIQIAAAKLEGGSIVDWYVTFVNPGKPLPEEIVHLTGIHEEDVSDAPSPQEALAGLVDFAGDAIMVAHNVPFDKTFTTRHPEGYPLLENAWVDSLDLSRIALPRLKSHRLIDLVHTFGAPASTHRADDDVAATCVVYRILLAAVTCMPFELVNEIAHMATPLEWSTQLVFEKIADMMAEPDGEEEANSKRLFSLHAMRQRRITTLPSRFARKDADDIVAQMEFPSRETIDDAFSSEGVLGSIYGDYEPRCEQREMAMAIRDAFEAGENIVVEAGTGVGKSMAYLIPAALTAKSNGIAVGVATKTNSLLDQLVYSELPALADALEQLDPHAEPLLWAPLKGMSHYPCLRKISRIVDNGPSMKEVAGQSVSQAPSLAALLSYIEQSEFDDMDSLK
ncbi:MAG: DNA polymerase III subunit epsilon, partial [Eggerthellaceae bacterium]|nr:DNA polymerase III subunit epsilon [Eggerthellaceae bacterium]